MQQQLISTQPQRPTTWVAHRGSCHTLHSRRASKQRAAADVGRADHNPFGVVIEADGVLTDLHSEGHRAAFNKAFKELGFACTNWSAPVYNDLLSSGDGTGEGLVRAYFTRVGWPTFLPTNEQDLFTRKVHDLKQAQLEIMVKQGSIPLRADVDRVLGDAMAAGGRLIAITNTLSQPADGLTAAVLSKLPPELSEQLVCYSAAVQPEGPTTSSSTSDLDTDSSSSSSSGGFSSASLAAAAAQVKQQGARQFVAQLQQDMASLKKAGVPVTLDAGLMAAGPGHGVTVDWLAAIAALHQLPCERCLVLAANGGIIRAAAAAGMTPVAVPRAGAFAASYPEAKAKFEGFGAGYATWPRLQALLKQ